MLADESPKVNAYGPSHFHGSPITLHFYIPEVDAKTQQAVSAGAKVIRPVEDQFYGDRTAGLEDPFGHKWFLATHVRDVPMEELKQHMQHMAAA